MPPSPTSRSFILQTYWAADPRSNMPSKQDDSRSNKLNCKNTDIAEVLHVEGNENNPENVAELIAEVKNFIDEFDARYAQLEGKSVEQVRLDYDKAKNVEVCMAEDISHGKEKFPIRAMNGVDYDRPPPLTYVTSMVYPSWYRKSEPAGCDCVDGCSDSRKCPCVVKNNRCEIPFNETGCIMSITAKIHECGPLCKCPLTCMNRVGQSGLLYQLEIFKTENRGWGVRSRDHIPSGGFVCDYVGELLTEKEADQRIGGDEYLFDVSRVKNGFAIDGAVFGNVARFINHSCSPNTYSQRVSYDHDDERMAHIMFFAMENIPPLKELSYDYNYKLGKVVDANGNMKIKECYCGSRKCKKRMY